ncbi:hypothetical protein A2757_01155 [Candidatus Giovannonibacteria bacterium RIFCSPHIGHO2_01_FULL_48_47]|nr:MAG: hypothetical protein A2757_01155 [Candidatus Giovannonibacteria bacterium RIFCSPHIGHO2_01_FULL_48_47]OGF67734.1 MAG: hypothetical protein A3D61_03740 [Candidatus Giovannonibacteria bacterium RIFCSPHIGHO2_02_FULL_48_15]OGF88042.1 MAG: hypothetical protein A3B26_00990 [Candidatus Giovannonibacteria bacterium RIFCSPLOWO2_01_FULL_48_47]OGF94837.1 MAG: hypothetical protein A2433_02385 [Candidatus Giovannonibacteria bacterium RIFOXYC1_FULL_48_8]OGF95883.1 MAG: hypothetical protein A2613_03640
MKKKRKVWCFALLIKFRKSGLLAIHKVGAFNKIDALRIFRTLHDMRPLKIKNVWREGITNVEYGLIEGGSQVIKFTKSR